MGLKILTKNISYLFVARIITTIFVSGSMLFLVRYLGPEKLGIYSFVITLLFIFSALADPGISMSLTKEIAQNPEKTQRFFREHLTIQIMITIVTICIVIIAAILTESLLIKNLLLLGIIGLFFNSILYPFATILSAKEDMKFNVICSLLGGIATIVITFIGIHGHYGLNFFMLLGILPSFISLIVAILLSRKYIKIQFAVQLTHIKEIFFKSLPFFALTATGLLYTRIDLIMLKMIDSNHVAGLYNAAYKIIFFLFVIPISVRSAVYPMLSNYHKNQNDKVLFVTSKLIKYMLLLSTCISVLIFLHADIIIRLLFGSKFAESANCLKILIWMFIPYCGYIVTMFYLNSSGQIKYVMKVSIFGLIINILLNFYLIPQRSMYGASIATIITEIFVFVGVMLKTLKEYREVNKNAFIVKLFFISLLGLLLAVYLPEFYQSIFFFCYFLLCIYLFRIIDAEEKYALKFIYHSFTDKFRNKK